MDRICLPEIPLFARHGVYDQEQREPQHFLISLTLFLDLHQAGLSDDLADTVDYGALYQRVREFAENNSYHLIEALAERIATLALAEPLVQQVTVRVKKCAARAGEVSFPAEVILERAR